MVRNLANAFPFTAVGVRVQRKGLCTRRENETKGGSGDGTEHGRIAPCSEVGARGYLLFCALRRIIDSLIFDQASLSSHLIVYIILIYIILEMPLRNNNFPILSLRTTKRFL